jgi:hypothetical protein
MSGSNPSLVSLYLGYATAIATFSAAAAALGLLRPKDHRQRIVSVAVLLFATLGSSAALATVSAGRTSPERSFLIAVGILSTGAFVLSRAFQSIFSDREDADAGKEKVLRRPMWMTAAAFLVVVVSVARLAMSDLFDDFLRSRPIGGGRQQHVLVAIDVSGSMDKPLVRTGDQRRIEAAVDASTSALAFLGPEDDVGVWTFADRSSELAPLEPATRQHLDRVQTDLRDLPRKELGGGTALYDTIARGVRELQTKSQSDATNTLVILTDGMDNGSGLSVERLYLRLEEGARTRPVRVLITAAFETRCDRQLSAIARCFKAATPSQLRDTLGKIVTRLQGGVPQ